MPLIPFKRWFDLIAKPIIEKEWKNDCRNALNAKFHAAKAGTSIMDAMFSYEDMIAEVKQNLGVLISPNRTTMICKCLEYRFNYLRKML